MVRPAQHQDALQVTDIYNHYIMHTNVTFEKTPISVQEMYERIQGVQTKYPWLVIEEQGKVQGYAYATEWKPRGAYRHSVESTVYLRNGESGKGYGSLLYTALLEALEKLHVHTVIGGIALPNDPSIRLHEKHGFTKVAHFKEVGYKFDTWIDVAYWQLIF